MIKCANCGSVNSDDKQVCGVCGQDLGTPPARLEQAEQINEPKAYLQRKVSRTGIARFWNSRWAAALTFLLVFGLMLGLVVLFSFGSFKLPIGYPANGQYIFDLIYVWIFLLLLGLVGLTKLFGMLIGDHSTKSPEKPDTSVSRDIRHQPTRADQEDE